MDSAGQSAKLSELNKNILEIKKKIQLSEGQRKAIFEDCETELKSNTDQIVKLKKEISELVVSLHESTCPTAKYLIHNKRLEDIIGPVENKTTSQVQELLDLQIIDKIKQLDLLRYKMKKKKNYLETLGEEYQIILSKKEKIELEEKVEKPIRRESSDFQNSIHAVEVQLREANHIKSRYHEIKKSLKSDSEKFECSIQKLREERVAQKNDLAKLQKIMDEATKMRASARKKLLAEEKAAQAAAHKRDKETAEGKRLVNERKLELERMEKKLFQSGKIAVVRPEPEGAENDLQGDEYEKPETPDNIADTIVEDFEILKNATGATSAEEVLERFKVQKETFDRLSALKGTNEEEKKNLEFKLDELKQKLDGFKYAQAKETEKKSGETDQLENQIKDYQEQSRSYTEQKMQTEESITMITEVLQKLHLSINPLAIPENDSLILLDLIKADLDDILQKSENKNDEKEIRLDVNDEKWLPPLYSGLIRRTPLPQPGVSPAPQPPPGSDDEEEVPSRGYLKRQAQLVIDAKSRRKNIRLQLGRTKT